MRGPLVALVLAVVAAGCFHAAPVDDGTAPASTNGSSTGNGSKTGAATSPPGGNGPSGPIVIADPPCAFDGTACQGECPSYAACFLPTRVVVAVVDSGINPYHTDFRAPPRPALAGMPAARALPLTLNAPYAEAVQADEAVWGSVETGVLYTIPGTRIVGAITMGDLGTTTAPSTSLILDDVGHGTGTASALARNSPHADIVMVQVGAASLDKGVQWAAEQPWIDVVSVSWGTIGNVPVGLLGDPLVDALKAAADAGKIVLVAAGNEPTPAMIGFSGPTWVISVGGSSPDGKGETTTAAKGVDVVSDFSPVVARHDDVEGTAELFGTSFGTPTVAGALAEALWIARSQGADVPAAALRQAMNAVAVYWTPTDYAVSTIENPVLVPCAQQGWGYIDGTHAVAIAAVAAGAQPAPEKPEAAICMSAMYAARTAVWG